MRRFGRFVLFVRRLDHSLVPYAAIAGASLSPTDHVTKHDPAVSCTRWSATVPGFDGMPFSVDVTVPCNTTAATPTIVMAHGFSDDKTVWEETGKSDSSLFEGRPEQNSRWNNIWFVTQGYVVVNYTARGWHDSCGPNTPGAAQLTPAPQCLGFEYWIHLDDERWEVRDAQWLAGGLVQSGMARPDRLAITGGSFGGGPTSITLPHLDSPTTGAGVVAPLWLAVGLAALAGLRVVRRS